MAETRVAPPELSGKPNLSPIEEWRDQGHRLATAKSQNQWWLGDWWNAGEAYGERVRVAEELGLNPASCRNLGSVAAAFRNVSRRRDTLAFAHHAVVLSRGLNEADQDRLLDWCLIPPPDGRARRSIRELGDEVERLALRRIAEASQASWKAQNEQSGSGPPYIKGVVTRPIVEPRPEPAITLDRSPAGRPLPPELAKLREEPVKRDLLAIGRALFADMTADEQHQFVQELAERLGYRLQRQLH